LLLGASIALLAVRFAHNDIGALPTHPTCM
jgi:hypothetical protein